MGKLFTIKRTTELEANPVIVDGKEIGAVKWSGCYFTKRGRSLGYWFIVGKESGATVPNHVERFKTMKAAAEALYREATA